MKKQYGIAIIGPGNVAAAHLDAVQGNPHAYLAAVGARNMEKAGVWAARHGADCPIYTDLDKLFADPNVDAVIVASPNNLHAAHTIRAAEAGKHILIEKPVALNLRDLRAMQAAVRTGGVRTLVSFVLHWNPGLRMARNLVQNDAIGRPFMVETCYWHNTKRTVPGFWSTTREQGGSIFFIGGCHATDAARWLIDDDVVEVSAYRTRGSLPWLEFDGTASALVKFRRGAIGRISATMECVMPYAFEVTVMGDKGTIRDNRLYSHLLQGQTDFASIPTIMPDSGAVTHHPFPGELEHFLTCIDEERETDVSLEQSVNTHEVCIAVDLSHEQGKPIRLPLGDEYLG